MLIVLHDVTRLRHLENVRRDFVANVSHELRTPITSIKGFVETLLEDGFADQASAQRFLGIVLRQVNRLDAIISDLLLLSRIERERRGPAHRDRRGAAGPCRAGRAGKRARRRPSTRRSSLCVECPDDLVAKINGPLVGAGGDQPHRQRDQVQRRRLDGAG